MPGQRSASNPKRVQARRKYSEPERAQAVSDRDEPHVRYYIEEDARLQAQIALTSLKVLALVAGIVGIAIGGAWYIPGAIAVAAYVIIAERKIT